MTLEEQLKQVCEKLEAAIDAQAEIDEESNQLTEASLRFLQKVAQVGPVGTSHIVEDKTADCGYAMMVVRLPDGLCARAASDAVTESEDKDMAMLAVMQTAIETNRALAAIQGMREFLGLDGGGDIRQK